MTQFDKRSYVVSFWVLQEDRMKTSSSMETVLNEIGTSLEIGLDLSTSATAKATRRTQSRVEQRDCTFIFPHDRSSSGSGGNNGAFPERLSRVACFWLL